VPDGAFTEASLSYAPGVRLRLQPGDDCHAAIAAIGVYELPSSRLTARLARRGGLLVDVGANYGYYSAIWLANSSTNRVVAIEPSPPVAAALKHNLDSNGFAPRARILAVAADRQSGQRSFDVLTEWGTSSGRFATSGEGVEVPTIRLDELLGGEAIDLLKIDAEGADAWVVEGARSLFEAGLIRTVLFENHPVGCDRFGIDRDAAPAMLRSYGYKLRSLRDSNWIAEQPA
jgi:FkbM family methyltransferase